MKKYTAGALLACAAACLRCAEGSVPAPPQGPSGPQPPAIVAFTASPGVISPGQTSTLSWSVTFAASLTIDGGVGDVTGQTSKVVSPGANATYTLTATSSAG